MYPEPTNSTSAIAEPSTADMLRIWRADRCLRDSSAGVYLQWVRRFRIYCAQQQLDEQSELTLEGARRFMEWYARRRQLDPNYMDGARTALLALRRVYQAMDLTLPEWCALTVSPLPASALLLAYADHLTRQHGHPAATVHQKLDHAGKLLACLAQQGKEADALSLPDIDTFLIECAHRYARSTTAGIASSIRTFVRFLLVTGHLSSDLADAVIAPVRPKDEQPRHTLPWTDVQRLLNAVETSTARGLRDHAILLLMSTYGLGAGEVIRLRLQDIDWVAGTIQVTRPKTGVVFLLPLLPAVAEVLARYLCQGRPPHTPTRHLFVQMKMPFSPLSASSAIRHILVKHAAAAHIDAPYLGSHVLRHANAARHFDVGTPSRVLSGLLGHRDPESVSAYLRIATETLRDVSLPVPT